MMKTKEDSEREVNMKSTNAESSVISKKWVPGQKIETVEQLNLLLAEDIVVSIDETIDQDVVPLSTIPVHYNMWLIIISYIGACAFPPPFDRKCEVNRTMFIGYTISPNDSFPRKWRQVKSRTVARHSVVALSEVM